MKSFATKMAASGLGALGAAVVMFVGGCATPDELSYNEQFGENLPTQPQYYIKDEAGNHFIIVVHQGSPSGESNRSDDPDRVNDLKQAATQVANAETQRLGWDKWHMNYIQERDQGWMHIVEAKVTREVYGEPAYPN